VSESFSLGRQVSTALAFQCGTLGSSLPTELGKAPFRLVIASA
jgi:hypothetical protein